LKIWCVRNEIWDDVNPEVCDEQPILTRPIAPSIPSELNAETRANFQIENAVYTNELRLWKEKDMAFKQLDDYLKASVGEQFKQHLMGKTSERAKLKSLFEQVKPTVASIKADLKAEYELLKATPFGKNVNEYFSRWQILCIKCQTNTHSIFVTGEEDPALALHEALQPIHPITAIFRTNKVNDDINAGKVIKLLDEIKAWQSFLDSKGILKFPSKAGVGKNAAFSTASLQGINVEYDDRPATFQALPKSSSNQSNRPECVCGKFHDIAYCNYLNPKKSRPSWWKPNKDIKAKIERYCRDHPDFARKVQDQLRNWEVEQSNKKKGFKKFSGSMQSVAFTEEDNIGAAILAGSASSCSLFNSVILDSGTNVHVVNDAMAHRILNSREATSADKVFSGDGVLQATAIVQAEVHVKLGERSKVLTLNEAFFIPGYMTNLVSLKRLNSVNIHHDSSNPLQLYYFANNERRAWIDLTVSQSGHWVLEDLSKPIKNSSFAAKSSSAPRKSLVTSPSRWHRILGHPGVKAIESLPQNVVGCEFDSKEKISTVDCESCLIAKAKAVVSRRTEKNREISIINEKSHMVVVSWDITEFTVGLEGSKYMSHFYYDAESFHHVKCTKTKAEAAAYLKTWFPRAQQLFGAHLYDPLRDITLGQLIDEKQHLVTLKKIELPDKSVTLDLDPYICSSTPIFQVENPVVSHDVQDQCSKKDYINIYPTPSPTVSREQTCEPEDFEGDMVDDLGTLYSQDLAGANVYLGAFAANFMEKQSLIENTRIHRDELPPPPKTWRDLKKH
ncbi:hypothetical protein EPUL_006225, partial [Erysiphe pulchra]